jgi:2-polyprenyl-6-methoxyphenol hydroxylase-like FAD-dependent oxidoreductase
MKGHAEIAGGGIAGLSSATMLAKQGWTVRVHERSAEIRELGAGIFIKNNAIEVLEEIGVFHRLSAHGLRLERAQLLDQQGRVMQERPLRDRSRVYIFLRQRLVESLRGAAEQAGVEIVTGSTAITADPKGELLLENGRRLRADIVIVADGARSKLRAGLGIGAEYRVLPTVVSRYLLPSLGEPAEPITSEHWSDRYTIGITPCADNLTYVYQVCPQWDRPASSLPSDLALWSKAFPQLKQVIGMLSQSDATQHNYSVVRCPRWHKGRVAIIGDAAHALPPTLGQGVGLTVMNGYALATTLGLHQATEDALPAWETAVRFVSDRTQRWSLRYDFLARHLPRSLWYLRPTIIWAFRSVPALNKRMRIADQGLMATQVKARAL